MRGSHGRPLHVAIFVIRKGGKDVSLTVGIAARGADVHPFAKTGKVGTDIIGTQGRHGKHIVIHGRMLNLAPVIAGGKDNKTTCHRPCLHAVLVQPGVGVEVVDSLYVGLGRFLLVVGETPAAVNQHGTIVCRIHKGCGSQGTIAPVQCLGYHQAYAAAGSAVSTGNAAHADSIVIHGGNRAGHMRTMVAGLNLANSHLAVRRHETVSVDIVGIAIIVVIFARQSVKLCLVHPHIGMQVFVHVIYADIVHSHNHFRITGFNGPGAERVYVAAFCPLVFTAGILIVPLLREPGIVEGIRHLPGLRLGDILHDFYIFEGGRNRFPSLGHRNGLVKNDVVPQVKTCGAVTLLPLPCRRKRPGKGVTAQGKRGAFFRLMLEFDTDDAGGGSGCERGLLHGCGLLFLNGLRLTGAG